MIDEFFGLDKSFLFKQADRVKSIAMKSDII